MFWLWILLVLSLGLGLSMAIVTSATAALVADQATGAHGSALGVMSTIMDIGHSAGPVVAGLLIAAYHYRAAFAAIRLALAATALVFAFLSRPSRDASSAM